jgi:purine-binding chemotaxis protein CheW
MESGGEPPPDEVARILRKRAEELATPPAHATPPAETIELLVFTLAGERFAIDTAQVLEATSLRELIPVPCTPAFVLGLVNHRGRILTVLDLRRLLNLPGTGMTEGGRVLAVEAGGLTCGIMAETVAGTLSVPARKVAPPPEALTGLRLALTSGITEDLITVLDLEALARTREILVNEEVG